VLDATLPQSLLGPGAAIYGAGLKLTPLADGSVLLSYASVHDYTYPPAPTITVLAQVFDSSGQASGSSFELGV